LLISYSLFAIDSGLYGLGQSMWQVIVGRAIVGLGGAGPLGQSVWISNIRCKIPSFVTLVLALKIVYASESPGRLDMRVSQDEPFSLSIRSIDPTKRGQRESHLPSWFRESGSIRLPFYYSIDSHYSYQITQLCMGILVAIFVLLYAGCPHMGWFFASWF